MSDPKEPPEQPTRHQPPPPPFNPQLDLIGVQLYADIAGLDAKIRKSGWTGPYVVTEWGPTGHWESPLTPWGAPIEDDSARKAMLLRDRYLHEIAPDDPQRLGSFVFLWGAKQERTPTWYGLGISRVPV